MNRRRSTRGSWASHSPTEKRKRRIVRHSFLADAKAPDCAEPKIVATKTDQFSLRRKEPPLERARPSRQIRRSRRGGFLGTRILLPIPGSVPGSRNNTRSLPVPNRWNITLSNIGAAQRNHANQVTSRELSNRSKTKVPFIFVT